MTNSFTRRNFLTAATGAVIAAPSLSAAITQDRKPALADNLVQEFVGASHGQVEKVKELLADNPTLLNATWDWQNGDFETGIGAAGHIGHRELALFFIEQGARTDLFVHTMLGHLDIVKPILTRYPEMVNCKGPHGITLIRHAEAGREEAKEVLDYLKSIEKTLSP
jgi:hypothetical protein